MNMKPEIRKLSGALGAEVRGVDFAGQVSDDQITAVRQALADHLVLTFPDQALDPDGQKRVTRHFGEFGVEPFVRTMPDHPEIVEVIKAETEVKTVNFGGQWHSDWSFQQSPPAMTILHAKELPPYGGDTLFCNMYRAFETLSPGFQEMLAGLTAIHSARRSYGLDSPIFGKVRETMTMKIDSTEEAHAETEHPAVITHPVTGRRALFINAVYTTRFKDMTEAESQPILDYLHKHATNENNICRVSWQPEQLTMWDNRVTQHFAMNDYDGHRRRLHRTTVKGEQPIH